MPNLTQLNSANLQAFIEGDLLPFLKRITELRAPGQDPPSLFDVANRPRPLVLGQMNDDSDTGGGGVVKNAITAAEAIDKVLLKHQEAFKDLDLELRNVIKTFLKTQDDNLTSVEGQKFLTAINDYVGEMDGGSGGGSNSTSSSTGA
ncbi:type VII secretion system-associated protein [Streptomyces sp. NPDC004610]|uniref:type VII secretion system-associated protein n=1 Tax=unclassified Streptomyces TaxID=2593676 RepID=UPI00339EC4E6